MTGAVTYGIISSVLREGCPERLLAFARWRFASFCVELFNAKESIIFFYITPSMLMQRGGEANVCDLGRSVSDSCLDHRWGHCPGMYMLVQQ